MAKQVSRASRSTVIRSEAHQAMENLLIEEQKGQEARRW
jgi:hypothetical protein